MPIIHIVIIWLNLIIMSSSASAPIQWTFSNFFKAGSVTFAPSNTSGAIDQIFSTGYSVAMTNTTLKLVALGLFNLNYIKSGNNFKLHVQITGIGTTGFAFVVKAPTVASLPTLTLRYLAVDNAFQHPFSISYFVTSPSITGPASFSYYINFTQSTGVVLNLANDNVMLSFTHIMDYTRPGGNNFNSQVDLVVFNQSYYYIQFTVSGAQTINTFGYSRIIFDKTAIQSLGESFFTYGELSSLNNNVSALVISLNPFVAGNFFIAMNSFNITSQSALRFTTTFTSNSAAVTTTITYDWFRFHYWSYRLRQCPTGYPYFNMDTMLCYDDCGIRYYNDNTTWLCKKCQYTCYDCSNPTTCSQCNNTLDFRSMAANNTCTPITGYFDNLTTLAVPCLSPCLTCSGAQNLCLTCILGTYLVGDTCNLCSNVMDNCSECNISTECIVCQPGFIVNTSNLCDVSSCTDIQCLSCPNATNYCDTCRTGYTSISGVCTISCPLGSYLNTSNSTCDLCSNPLPFCGQCTNNTVCISCQSGYFLNGTNQCQMVCNDLKCLSCTTSVSYCDSCISGYVSISGTCTVSTVTCTLGSYLVTTNNTCDLCSNPISFCAECNNNLTCTLCKSGYLVNNAGQCDVSPCKDLQCLSCSSDITFCDSCKVGYNSVGGVCKSKCGDSLLSADEQCQDGNLQTMDGCSELCKIQDGFICFISNITKISECTYTKPIQISLVYMKKSDDSNGITIKLSVSPLLKSLGKIDLSKYLTSDIPLSDVTVTFDPVTGDVLMNVKYTSSIQGKPATITFNPPKDGVFKSTPSSSLTISAINPDNNQAAYFYPDEAYNIGNIVNLLSMATGILSYIFFLIGLIAGKMIGVEMMAVLQLSFLSLMTVVQMNPSLSGLLGLFFVNGYNKLPGYNSMLEQGLPIPPKGMYLFGDFLKSFNLTILLFVIPILLAIIFYILEKTLFKQKKSLMQLLRKRSIGQYAFTGLMFCSYITMISFSLEIFYGIKSMKGIISYLSIAVAAIMVISIVIYFIFIIKKPQYFGQYTQEFKSQFILSQKFYNYLMIERFIIPITLIAMLNMNFDLIIPQVLLLAQLLYVLIKKPYEWNPNNYRVITNMLITIIILGIYLYYRMSPQDIHLQSYSYYIPLIIIILLLVCVIYNGIFIIVFLIKNIRKWRKTQDGENKVKQQLKMLREGTFQMTRFPFSPVSQINQKINNMTDAQKQEAWKNYAALESPKLKTNLIKKQLQMNPSQNYQSHEANNQLHEPNSPDIIGYDEI